MQSDRSLLLARLVDVHNHIFDSSRVNDQFTSKLSKVCVMSSTLPSQAIVENRSGISSAIIPFYGVHPWFTHHLSTTSSAASALESKSAHYQQVFECDQISLQPYFDQLPDPVSLEVFLREMERLLIDNPYAQVGEIGLDRIFKLPFSIANYVTTPAIAPTSPSCNCHAPDPPSSTSNPPLDHKAGRPKILKTSLQHQQRILAAQINLAIKHNRSISCHSVQSSEAIIDSFRKMKAENGIGWTRTAVCVHSFGGSAESARVLQKEHPNLFFSFSKIVSERSKVFVKLVEAIEPQRLLLESDHSNPTRIDGLMLEIFDLVAGIRGMSEERLVELLEVNWRRYMNYDTLQ